MKLPTRPALVLPILLAACAPGAGAPPVPPGGGEAVLFTGARAYFEYFGDAAGEPGKGWYS
ncbi:MAG: hypothetical protein R6U63_03760 [Longimicrobiales bacterium]